MMKKLLLTILAIYVVTHTTGCSSGSPKDEAEVAATEDEAFAEEGESDFAEADNSGSEEASEESGEEVAESDDASEEAAEGEGEEVADNADEKAEEKTEDGGEEDLADAEDATEEEAEAASEGTEVAETEDEDAMEFPEEAPEETAVASSEEPSDEKLFTADNNETTPAEEAPPASSPTEDQSLAQAPVVDETPSNTFASSDYSAEAPVYRPLMKVKDTPFDRNGTLMNRVYISRAGDTYKSVSEKIYGDAGRAGDLKKWNQASRNSLKVGEKVYYNSPREPQDSSRMLTYYEDAGIQPQIHVTQSGENIRELGKTLLGDGNGWKELWSTNLDVESKGDLPPGVQLKYWTDAAVPAQTVAQAPTEPPPVQAAPVDPMAGAQPPTDMAANQPPPADPMQVPPPADPMAGAPPPAPDMAATDPMAGSTPEMAPPPVAGTTGDVPPPPPAEPVMKKTPATAEVAEDDMTTTMGIAGLGLVGLAVLFIMMKKNRARRIDLSQTQV